MEVNVLLNGVNIGAMASRGHENNLRCGLGLGRGCACGGFCANAWLGEESETSRSGLVLPRGGKKSLAVLLLHLLESPTKMSEDKGEEPIQLGKRTLDAIIEGVAAKLRESPPEKRPKDRSGSSSAGKGE